jgi:hypothetical protein
VIVKTKYFGKIDFSEIVDVLGIHVRYRNREVTILFGDKDFCIEKVDRYLSILDNYCEIRKITEKAIMNDCLKTDHYGISLNIAMTSFPAKTVSEYLAKMNLMKLI